MRMGLHRTSRRASAIALLVPLALSAGGCDVLHQLSQIRTGRSGPEVCVVTIDPAREVDWARLEPPGDCERKRVMRIVRLSERLRACRSTRPNARVRAWFRVDRHGRVGAIRRLRVDDADEACVRRELDSWDLARGDAGAAYGVDLHMVDSDSPAPPGSIAPRPHPSRADGSSARDALGAGSDRARERCRADRHDPPFGAAAGSGVTSRVRGSARLARRPTRRSPPGRVPSARHARPVPDAS